MLARIGGLELRRGGAPLPPVLSMRRAPRAELLPAPPVARGGHFDLGLRAEGKWAWPSWPSCGGPRRPAALHADIGVGLSQGLRRHQGALGGGQECARKQVYAQLNASRITLT